MLRRLGYVLGYRPAPPSYHQAPSEFPVKTMHAMQGYPMRPPLLPSDQTSPIHPSPAFQPHNLYSNPVTAPMQPPFGGVRESPISSILPTRFGSVGQAWHSRYDLMVDEVGDLGPYRGMPYFWNSPSIASPLPFHSPFQPQPPMVDGPLDSWSGGASPKVSSTVLCTSRYMDGPPRDPHTNRVSWGGASRGQPDVPEKKCERKAYHPQLPERRRCDWVTWVGNV
jgi:hypothetical protein